MRIYSLVVPLLLALGASHADAGIIWSETGASCIPDSATVSGGIYDTIAGYVRIKSSSAGTLNLYCPVFVTTSPTSLGLDYYSAGSTSSNQVSAAYYKMSKSTGSLTLIAAQNSTNCGTGYHASCSTTFKIGRASCRERV